MSRGELMATPPKSDEEAVGDSLNREREALLKVQRMRFWLAVGGAGVVGFSLGALTTYQIACSLRPRR
jgi:dienelactone hydrolase